MAYYYSFTDEFELDLIFKDKTTPSEALNQLAKMYERLNSLDNNILHHLYPDASVSYELVNIQVGSLKSKIRQVLNKIPDEALKEILNPAALVGQALVYIKYRVLKAIDKGEVGSAEGLKTITKDINHELKKLPSNNNMLIEVNNYYILNTINDLSTLSGNLKDEEYFVYKTKEYRAELSNDSSVDMSKILHELGEETLTQQRRERLQVKTIELLSDETSWKLIRSGKTIDVKIKDKDWLDRYHKREFTIRPNDSLELELKITCVNKPNSRGVRTSYEALKIYDVIPPDESGKQFVIFST